MNPLVFGKSSFSMDVGCWTAAGDRIFWSITFMLVFDDDTLFMAIGLVPVVVELNIIPSYFGM